MQNRERVHRGLSTRGPGHTPDDPRHNQGRSPRRHRTDSLRHAHLYHGEIYPTPTGIEAFKIQLSGYKNAKGSVQFPLRTDIPFELIRRIVRYRVEEENRLHHRN